MTNKIKYLFIALTLTLISATGNAQKSSAITADPFPVERPGQYVYYHDMRKGVYGNKEPVDRLIGLMKAENKQYIIRICNVKDGKSYLFMGRFVLNNGVMEYSTESIQGDVKEGTVLMADLLNLLSYLGSETIKISPNVKSKNDVTVSSIWKEYNRKLNNSYKWWIPFYRLESCSNSESDNYGEKGYTSLKIVCFGAVAQNDPDMFTRIIRLPVYYTEKISDKKYIIPPAEKITVRLDNTSLKLDKNWHFEKANPAAGFPDSFWLKKYSARDAQVGVESIELNNIKLEKGIIDSFVSSLRYQSCVIPDTVKIDSAGKTLSLSLWDADSNTATFIKYISLGIKNNLLSMINFSALDFIYYGNFEYFNAILDTGFNN